MKPLDQVRSTGAYAPDHTAFIILEGIFNGKKKDIENKISTSIANGFITIYFAGVITFLFFASN